MDIKITLDEDTLEKVWVLIQNLEILNSHLEDVKLMIADKLGWIVK